MPPAIADEDEAARARELLDGGPPLLAGALVAVVAALFAALLGWLAWAQVEEVVHATGARRSSTTRGAAAWRRSMSAKATGSKRGRCW